MKKNRMEDLTRMRTVRFANVAEPSIHNLNDAPAPSNDTICSRLSRFPDDRHPTQPPPAPPSPALLSQKGVHSTPPPPPPRERKVEVVKQAVELEESDAQLQQSTSLGELITSSSFDGDDYSSDEDADDLHNTLSLPVVLTSPRGLWGRRKRIIDQMSRSIVRHAPCFWCFAKRMDQTSVTDRSILFRLNVLCAFFALVQMGSAAFLLVALFAGSIADRSEINSRESNTNSIALTLWNVNGNIFLAGVMGFVIFVTMVSTLRNIRHVNLLGSIRYMWALCWILPIEIFIIITLFDYHRVAQVWIKHWWNVGSMAWFRDIFCANGTSRTLCTVPVCGLPAFGRDSALPEGGDETCREGENNWCMAFYNATNCTSIRDDAQEEMSTAAYLFYTLNAVWGLLLIVLLLLTVHRLESIVTKPVVQRSRESNVPGWLTLPFVGCLVAGCILLFSQSSVFSSEARLNPFWIGIAYFVSAALFFIAALLGWFISVYTILNSRDQKTKHAAALLFIATMMVTTLVVAAVFASCIVYSVNLVDVPLTDNQRGTIACFIDTVDSCSFCNDTFPDLRECPQWTDDDVVRVLRTQLKGSAVLAAISFIYSFGALRFGFVLRKHISQYEIDYC